MTIIFTREQLIDEIDFIKDLEDFKNVKQELFAKYVYDFDIDVVKVLLNVGVDPNVNVFRQYKSRNHGFLHDLIHEYFVQRVLKGDLIFELISVLLKYGANPDQPGDCNTAPIQHCLGEDGKLLRDLLLSFGAKPEGNERY